MPVWFETKAKYVKTDQDSRERKVSETYLIDAVNCTEAETRARQLILEQIRGESVVTKISQSNIIEIFPSESGEYWWKAKVSLITIDEKAGKEKKVNNYFLVSADTLKEAERNLSEGLSYVLVPYHVESISLSSIVDVLPYFETAIPTNPENIPQDQE